MMLLILLPSLSVVGLSVHLQRLCSDNALLLHLLFICRSVSLQQPLHLGHPIVLVPCPAHEACIYYCHDVDHQQLVLQWHSREVHCLDDRPEGCLSSQGWQEINLQTEEGQNKYQSVQLNWPVSDSTYPGAHLQRPLTWRRPQSRLELSQENAGLPCFDLVICNCLQQTGHAR